MCTLSEVTDELNVANGPNMCDLVNVADEHVSVFISVCVVAWKEAGVPRDRAAFDRKVVW